MENFSNKLDEIVEKESKGLIGFFISHFRFTYLILMAIICFGIYAVLILPRESDPEIKVPFASVVTVFPGANPNDVEQLVTNKIEDKISDISDLQKYTSSSMNGVSTVLVEFTADADVSESIRKLSDVVDQVKQDLPTSAEDPIVTEMNISDIPIVTYSLIGQFSDTELKIHGEKIRDELEKISFVSRVDLIGGVEREFLIIVDQTKLANYKLTLGQIISSVGKNNFNLPAGNIEIGDHKYNIRIKGKITEINDLKNIVVATYEGIPIYLSDVANVSDTIKEKTTESRIGFASELPSSTISLLVFKKTGGNILKIVDESNAIIDELQANNKIQKGLKIVKTNDNSVFIKEDLGRLSKSGIQTMLLIMVVLFFALGLSESIITGISVPIAFLMSFIVILIGGETLNGMVLFSLVLSLGLMVDNSIVITEGINEYMKKHGKTPREAVLLSVWNYKWPIIAGTMTTVAAFVPLLLVSGIMGQYLSVLPKTLTATLLSSLFVALVVIPTLASKFIKKGHEHNVDSSKKTTKHFDVLIAKINVHYVKILKYFLDNKKHRRMLLASVWVLFFVSVAIPILGFMKIEMFPKVDVDYFVVNIELPAGSTLDKTSQVVSGVEKIISTTPKLLNYVTNIGTSASIGLTDGNSENGSHLASITVNLSNKDERKLKSYEILALMRTKIENTAGADVTIAEPNAGPPTGAPIEIRIFGDDLSKLSNIASKVENILSEIPGVINSKINIKETAGEFNIVVNKQLANYYNLDTSAVASTVRSIIYGQEASSINIDGDDIDITVKYDKDKITNINSINNILLSDQKGNYIRLDQIATVSLEPSLLKINHRDGKKVISISADKEPNADLAKIIASFNDKQTELKMPSDYYIKIGGEVEDIDKSFRETFQSMIVAVLLIAIILVLQFNSFKQPLIILFTLPLAIIGVVIGLNMIHLPFSFPAFIGIVSLSGIVVNDAIVLIDKINKNIKYGWNTKQAILDAGITRMQPILLTTATTVAGIFPLALSSEIWRGLGFTIIFGLLFATFLTLIVVPLLYLSFGHNKK